MKIDRRSDEALSTLTPIGRLRAALDEAELHLAGLRDTPAHATAAIRATDAAERFLAALPERGAATAEVDRLGFVRGRLTAAAELVVRQVRTAGAEAELAASPTWQAVLSAGQRARAERRRGWLRAAAVVGALLLLLGVILPRLLPVPPMADMLDVARLVDEGNLPGALERARAEQARFPDAYEPSLWIGALSERQGDQEAAAAAYAEARRLRADDAAFLFERGMLRIELGMPDAAEADGRELVGQPGRMAEGNLLLATVAEARGDIDEAIAALERAAELASRENKPQLEVLAKARLGSLLQSAPLAIPTPTP